MKPSTRKAIMSFRCGNMVKVAVIIVPWLCAVALPAQRLDGFILSFGRCCFFEFVMMPFGNIALLGLFASAHGLMSWSNALFAFAGIVAPVAFALQFASCWRSRRFVLVWLGYVLLVAWDAVLASYIAVLMADGGFA